MLSKELSSKLPEVNNNKHQHQHCLRLADMLIDSRQFFNSHDAEITPSNQKAASLWRFKITDIYHILHNY